jgi:nitroreductase
MRLKNSILTVIVFVLLAGGYPLTSPLAQSATIPLPKPQTDGGRPLMQVLKDRKSTRAFTGEALTRQQLSNLLWAGFGINRPEIDHRTAPSAMNMQEVDLYVATAEGLFLFEAKEHQLKQLSSEDLRGKTGGQAFVKEAPVSLIYVADHARMGKARESDRDFYAAVDAGFIIQNVYLICASEGWAAVVHDLDRPALAQAMGLRANQKVMLAQAIGHPKP